MLTARQSQLLHFIADYLASHDGVSPSFVEMQAAMGLKSKSGIHRILTSLEQRGLIQRHHWHARAIDVVRIPEFAGSYPEFDLHVVVAGMVGKHGIPKACELLRAYADRLGRAA